MNNDSEIWYFIQSKLLESEAGNPARSRRKLGQFTRPRSGFKMAVTKDEICGSIWRSDGSSVG